MALIIPSAAALLMIGLADRPAGAALTLHALAQLGLPDGLHARSAHVCRLGRRSVTLILAGLSSEAGDEEKEFGSPYLFVKKGRHPPVLAAGGPSMALSLLKKSGSGSFCRDTLAFRSGPTSLGIAFKVDDRPMPEQLGVVFFDLRRNKLLKSADRLGAFTGLKPVGNALEFRSIVSRTESAGDLETTIKGQTMVIEEDELRPWYRVALAGNLARAADRELTWNESRFKPFFKTRDAFEKAFAFDADRSLYGNPWVYSVRLKDQPGEQCILPSAERGPRIAADSPWICAKL